MRFQIAKTMQRPLTPDEDAEILTYWEANQALPIDAVIEHFETKFGTPITKHHVMRLMMEMEMAEPTETQHTIRLTEAICAAMMLGRDMIKEMGFAPEAYKPLRRGAKFTGTLDEIAKLAENMQRGDGWDLPPQTIAALNRRAKQLLTFVRETRAGADEPNPNDAESARRDRGLPARDGTTK